MIWRWRLLLRFLLVLLSLLIRHCWSAQTFVRQPSDQYVRLGETVLLPCQVANAVGRVQWTRDEFGLGVIRDLPSYPRYQMIGDDTEGIYSLQIQRVALEDDAVFQCQAGAANDQPGIRSRNAHLMVLVAPDSPRILQGSKVQVDEGSNITLQCESRGGKPAVEIEWVGGKNEVINGSEVRVSTEDDGKRTISVASLTLKATAALNGESVMCRAHNAALAAPQTTAIQLSVRYKPRLRITADQSQLRELDDVILTCHSAANPEATEFRWWVSDELIAGESRTTLRLSQISRKQHNAEVRCEASNIIGSSSASYKLNILYEPRFREGPTQLAGKAGEIVDLQCEVDSNPPSVIFWYRLECSYCPEMVGSGSHLTFDLSSDSAGLYECRVNDTSATTQRHLLPSHSHMGSPSRKPKRFQQQKRRQVRVELMTSPQVTAPLRQYAAGLGDTTYVECHISGHPVSENVTWYHMDRRINPDSSEYRVVTESTANGQRAMLVIPHTRDQHLGTYNCTSYNSLGSGSALILLQKSKTPTALVTLSVVLGGVLLCVFVLFSALIYQRRRKPPGSKEQPAVNTVVSVQKPIVSVEPCTNSPRNSSTTDTKPDIRSGSPISGWGDVVRSNMIDSSAVNGGDKYTGEGGDRWKHVPSAGPPVRAGLLGEENLAADYFDHYSHLQHLHQSSPSPSRYNSESPSTYETINTADSPAGPSTGPHCRPWYDNGASPAFSASLRTSGAQAGSANGIRGSSHMAVLDNSRVIPAIASRVIALGDEDTVDGGWSECDRGALATPGTLCARLSRGLHPITSEVAALSRLKPGTLATHV